MTFGYRTDALALILGNPAFIHWNNGIHDCGHNAERGPEQFTIPDYLRNLRTVLGALRATGAKIVWATTTPLRNGKDVTWDTKAKYSDERIAARNALAAEVVAAEKIPTVDLNEAVRGNPELHSDNVHFNGQGSQILADKVAAELIGLDRRDAPD